jgi:hypothetical protein
MTIKQLGGVFGRNPTFNDVTIEGQLTFDGDIDINSDLTVNGDIKLNDNDKILLGNSQDLEIFHDGVNSHITDVGTGSLIIDGATSLQIKGSTFVIIRSSAGENMAVGNANGSFDLYFNGAKKLATSNSGVAVTGNVAVDSGNGIDFSATAGAGTSELFDDYEEGVWTPNLLNGTSITYTTTPTGNYTKIGNMVYVTASIDVSMLLRLRLADSRSTQLMTR